MICFQSSILPSTLTEFYHYQLSRFWSSERRNQRKEQCGGTSNFPGCSSQNAFLHCKNEIGTAWSTQVLKAELSQSVHQCSCCFPESTWPSLDHYRGSKGIPYMVQVIFWKEVIIFLNAVICPALPNQ